jgi:hypothetical protein
VEVEQAADVPEFEQCLLGEAVLPELAEVVRDHLERFHVVGLVERAADFDEPVDVPLLPD